MSRPTQSPWILGTAQLGMAYGATNTVGRPSPDQAAGILAAARDAGVSHVDTARAYGESESVIGTALRAGVGLGVVTKLRPLGTSAADPAAEARESFVTSLTHLGVESVDALLVHRAADWVRPGVRAFLAGTLAAGEAKRVGASVSTPAELLRIVADPLCEYVQFPFNVLDRRWLDDEVVDALRRRPDVVVTVRSVFLQGLLLTTSPDAWPTHSSADPQRIISALAEMAEGLGRTGAADLCVAYALGHPFVTSVAIGAESAAYVTNNAELATHPPLDEDAIARVKARIPAAPVELVDPSQWPKRDS